MAQIVKLRRSSVSGQKPTNSNLQLGELALNTTDGKVYMAKSGSLGPSIEEIISTNTVNTGSIYLTDGISGSTINALTSLTASGLHYPTTDGIFTGQVIQTDAAGNLSFGNVNAVFEAIYNGEATTITKGTALYVSGSQGANPIVYRADSSNPSKMPVTFVAMENIGTGAIGRGVTLGLITGINMSGYPVGSFLWVDGNGTLTSTRPTGVGDIVQPIGIVTKTGNGGQLNVLNPGPVLLPNLPTGELWIGDNFNQPISRSINELGLAITGSNSFNGNQTITGSLTITQNLTVFGSSSLVYVTSSQLAVSASFISVNIYEPAERFGGLKVYDSGSSHATASLAWDSQHNHWVYQNSNDGSYSGGMLIAGPKNTGSLGEEQTLTLYRVPVSDGDDHIKDSAIIDSGSNVIIEKNTTITGSLTVSGGIVGTIDYSNITNKPDLVSGSSQISITGTTGYSTFSGSISSSIGSLSSSIATTDYNQELRLNSIEISTSSINSFTSSYSTGSFTGSFIGDGIGLYNIPASGVTGLQLDKIINGNASASIDNSGFYVNRDVYIDGTITAKEIHTDYVTSSVLFQSGSTKFGDTTDDTHQFTGSLYLSNNLTIGDDPTSNVYNGAMIKKNGLNYSIYNLSKSSSIFDIGAVDGTGFTYSTELYIESTSGKTSFKDFSIGDNQYKEWLAIPQNTGNNPLLEFKRGMVVTGSVSASYFTGSFIGNATGLTNVPFHITGSDVDGNQYNKTFTKLHFDSDTGLNVSESVAGTAFISIGSHFKDIFVSGSPLLSATGSDAFEIIPEGGVDITTSITDTNSNGYVKELKISTLNLSSSFNSSIATITGSISSLNNFTGSVNTHLSDLDNFTSSVVLTNQTSSMTVLSSSYAVTAAFALNVVGGGSGVSDGAYAELNQTTPSTSWTFVHNLGQKYPIFQVFDTLDRVIIPTQIIATDNNTATITFSSAQAGKVVASLGTGPGGMTQYFASATTWSLNHAMGTDYPIVTVYGSNRKIIYPQEVKSIDGNNVEVYFSVPVAGYLNVAKGGHIISGSLDLTQINLGGSGLVSGSGQIANFGYAVTGSNTFTGNQIINGTLTVNKAKLGSTCLTLSTGNNQTIFDMYGFDGANFDYVIKNGTNMRGGMIMSVWTGSDVSYNETSTTDLGNTSDVTFYVTNGGILKANIASGTWQIEVMYRALKCS
jgi:hypothetical protein